MQKTLLALVMVVMGMVALAERQGPWTKEKAWEWHNAQPWIRGCNYMPASAANRIDQWQSYGSDARFEEVEREFALAKEVGFNAMRIIVEWQGFAVWLQEPEAFNANFERYLGLLNKYGMRAVVVLGNDCCRPKYMWSMPKLGEQKYDVGYHGGRRQTQHGSFTEPGFLMVDEPEYHDKFFEFCRELVGRYAQDGRVLMWEVWNEPGAGNRGNMSAPVMRELFELCWKIDPIQPLAANLWSRSTPKIIEGKDPTEIEALALELSDVIAYHGYHSQTDQVKLVDELLRRWGRPLYNTEWMLRTWGCEFPDNYAFFAQRKIGALSWGFVNGKYQTHEPYEPMWKNKFDFEGGDPTRWFHDLFRISHHPYDPYEIAVARNINAWSEQDRKEVSLRAKVARKYKITGEDMWYGFRRTKFDFNGYAAWVVEPSTFAAEGNPWTWTMQWADAFVDRTGVLNLIKRGFHHATIDLFETKMDDDGIKVASDYQRFLVEELGLAPKANLIGMSWGGFFSVRYAAKHSDGVAKMYLDAPLMNFAEFSGEIGPWAQMMPADGEWTKDSRMPVNLAESIVKVPILLIYGGADTMVVPKLNCEMFVPRFNEYGGKIDVIKRESFGHHPHGMDPDKTSRIVNFFCLQ